MIYSINMELSKQVSLQSHNSFNVQSIAPMVYFPESIIDLKALPDLSNIPFYILGDGSNTLFVEIKAPVIIQPKFSGINIIEKTDEYIVCVGAGENWHNFVCFCINAGIYGLENLALIPGSIGAAPVQNIGAYGVELSDFCKQVKWFDFTSQTVKELCNEDCNFSYRNSIFKEAYYNKGIIIEVVFRFPKKWQANLSYAGLNQLDANVNAKQIMAKVISLREEKLPDPTLLPNAGSFFKNPIVNEQTLQSLKNTFPRMPFYRQDDGTVKLAAGWLIEQVGLKGYCIKGVGVHEHQALVLVNYKGDLGKEIVCLAQYVQRKVFEAFQILLVPEVRMVTAKGERNFASLPICSR